MLEIVGREAFGASFASVKSASGIPWVRELTPPPGWVSAGALSLVRVKLRSCRGSRCAGLVACETCARCLGMVVG